MPDGDDDDYDDDDDYSRVCGRTRDVLEKTARSKALLVFKTELSLLRSAWPPAESTVTLKITHAEA